MQELCSSQPGSTARFLELFADAITVDAPELLLHEPGLADVRGSIRTLVEAYRGGQPIQASLEPWIGRLATQAGLAEYAGCLNEWLRLVAAGLREYGPHRLDHISDQCAALFLHYSVPLPKVMKTLFATIEIADGESAAEQYPIAPPAKFWLVEAEQEGRVPLFFDSVAAVMTAGSHTWRLETKGMSRSHNAQIILGTIVLGLKLGYPLSRILDDLGQTDCARLESLSASFKSKQSLSQALFESGVLTHLGAKLVERAELAGNIEVTLLDVSRQVHDGLLFTVDDDTNLALSATVEHSDSPRPTRSRHEQSMDEWIEGISIVGRIAYAMLCIESAISAWGVSHSDKLLKAIDKLWDFTTSGALDVWDREIQAAIPGVAGFYDEQREEEEWRAGAEYFGFEHLEDSQQDALNWMIANAQEIGLGNLYAGYDSWCTAEPLVEVINTMQLSGLPLPPRGRVSLCRVQESDGWGVTQPREYFL